MTTIAWLIPRLISGSGGHRTILLYANALQRAGYRCVLYVEDDDSRENLADVIRKMFGFDFSSVRHGWSNIDPADLVFATIWYSANVVRDLSFPCIKCYLVQDYEALFNPVGDAYLMAENSYRYGLYPITIGRWLKHKLYVDFGVPAYHIDFCADTTIYHKQPMRRERSICFIYQPEKPRRCSQIGIEALGIATYLDPDVKVYLYGSNEKPKLWYKNEHCGLISRTECNILYNKCSVGLCLSSSNPSRVPFEMMASGLPVVELWRENNLYDMPHQAVSLCEQTPESLAYELLRILDDEHEISRRSEAGISFMKNRTEDFETTRFLEIIKELLNGSRSEANDVSILYDGPRAISINPVIHTTPRSGIHKHFISNNIVYSFPRFMRPLVRFAGRRIKKLISN
jgi:hypothetical protein